MLTVITWFDGDGETSVAIYAGVMSDETKIAYAKNVLQSDHQAIHFAELQPTIHAQLVCSDCSGAVNGYAPNYLAH